MKLEDYFKKHGNVDVDEKKLNEFLGIKDVKTSKAFQPKTGEEYWHLSGCGKVEHDTWVNDGADIGFYILGNCFKQKKEAEAYCEKLKIHRELKRYASEHNETEIDWNDINQHKYFINFDCINFEFAVNQRWAIKYPNTVYFTSEEIAQDAIQYIGENTLKKYYFDINE